MIVETDRHKMTLGMTHVQVLAIPALNHWTVENTLFCYTITDCMVGITRDKDDSLLQMVQLLGKRVKRRRGYVEQHVLFELG